MLGCASDSLTLPDEGNPAFLIIINGNGQQGRAGSRLTDSLVVLLTDGSNRAVVNQSIVFPVTSGGTVEPGTVLTNGEGKAVFRWVLGPAAGDQVLEARLGNDGPGSPRVTFTAAALPGPVRAMAVMSGDGQAAPVNTPLPSPLVVRLLDTYGNGVVGATVRWQTSAGRVNQSTVTTGSDGSASVVWTLGSTVGIQTAKATFQGASGSPITFTASASQGASPRLSMVTEPSGTTESGDPLTRQPEIRLETPLGRPIAQGGVSVTAAIASGGGTLSGTTTVKTNNLGVARFTDLVLTGTNGPRTLIFAAPNYTPAVSAQVQISTSGPSAWETTAHLPGGRAFRWTRITITTRNAAGDRMDRGGYAGLIKVSVSGANTNSSLTVFDQGDGTYEASYFPVFKGTDMVTITLAGTPIQGSPYQTRVK